ncbi:MAG: type I-U CRISPR-associated protein Cas7, partial [Myxococcaceae bacterium]|nr:type I-U CRISPR-associated protein Cas7 [Myxococcaceae bacterium]
NVPFQRDEFTADRITAFFSLDLGQVRAYGLGAAAETLLVALALYKVAAFLEGSLRLRTACDLECVEVLVRRPEGLRLPASSELLGAFPKLIAEARSVLGEGTRTVTFEASK